MKIMCVDHSINCDDVAAAIIVSRDKGGMLNIEDASFIEKGSVVDVCMEVVKISKDKLVDEIIVPNISTGSAVASEIHKLGKKEVRLVGFEDRKAKELACLLFKELVPKIHWEEITQSKIDALFYALKYLSEHESTVENDAL